MNQKVTCKHFSQDMEYLDIKHFLNQVLEKCKVYVHF